MKDSGYNSKTAVTPVTLESQHIRLEPLSLEYVDQLCKVGLEPKLWEWMLSQIHTCEDMYAYVEKELKEQKEGKALRFVIIDKAGNVAVGGTGYVCIDMAHRCLEIGPTWIGRSWQRTPVNTESKYLLLRHAFEVLRCVRVQFVADVLNKGSRQALLRIGAKEEGILRKFLITDSGRVRDTVCMSIIDSEWAEVKAKLEGMMHKL